MDWLDFQYVLTAWSMLVNAWLTYGYDMVRKYMANMWLRLVHVGASHIGGQLTDG